MDGCVIFFDGKKFLYDKEICGFLLVRTLLYIMLFTIYW